MPQIISSCQSKLLSNEKNIIIPTHSESLSYLHSVFMKTKKYIYSVVCKGKEKRRMFSHFFFPRLNPWNTYELKNLFDCSFACVWKMNAETYCQLTPDIYSLIQTSIKANNYRIPTMWQVLYWVPIGKGQKWIRQWPPSSWYLLKVVICVQDNIE